MRPYDRAVLRLASWAGMSDARRHELLADARLAARRTGSGTWRELWSVVVLCLQMRSVGATGGDAGRTIRHGARTGAALAMTSAALLLTNSGLHGSHPGAIALVVPALCAWALAERDALRLALIATGFVSLALAAQAGAVSPLASTLLLVAYGSIAIGDRGPVGAPRRARVAVSTSVVAAAIALLAMLDPSVVAGVVHIVLLGLLPAVLLVAGRHDPRLAVAATVVVIARFGTFDRHEVAVLAGQDVGADTLAAVVRLLLMTSFVAAGCLATRSALREHSRI